MLRIIKSLARPIAPVLLALALGLAAPVAAQFGGRLEGDVKDKEGKPFGGVIVSMKNLDRGQTLETSTDAKGHYSQGGMQPGVWVVTFKAKDPNTGTLVAFDEKQFRLATGAQERVDSSLKEIIEKMSAEKKEEMKKQQEEQNKFNTMKAHFDAGRAALDQIRATRAEMVKLPRAEQSPYQEKISGFTTTAVTEFEGARSALPANDPNTHIVLSNLGEAYEEAGRFDDAAAAYTKAIESIPQGSTVQVSPYYTKLGTALARAGKIDEAAAACEKGAAADQAQAAICMRNIVIVMQNKDKTKESLQLARKANQLDPNNAEGYYFLAKALVAAMEFKKEGDKYVTVVLPGTAEAYQKYLELAPNGRFAKDAQEGLAGLQALGVGIDTKVNMKKSSKKP